MRDGIRRGFEMRVQLEKIKEAFVGPATGGACDGSRGKDRRLEHIEAMIAEGDSRYGE
jgi:hypothetical protein